MEHDYWPFPIAVRNGAVVLSPINDASEDELRQSGTALFVCMADERTRRMMRLAANDWRFAQMAHRERTGGSYDEEA